MADNTSMQQQLLQELEQESMEANVAYLQSYKNLKQLRKHASTDKEKAELLVQESLHVDLGKELQELTETLDKAKAVQQGNVLGSARQHSHLRLQAKASGGVRTDVSDENLYDASTPELA